LAGSFFSPVKSFVASRRTEASHPYAKQSHI